MQAARAEIAQVRKEQARQRAAALAAATVTTGPAKGSQERSLSLAVELLLGVAAILVLLSLAPAEAAYALGPRAGRTFAQGRLAFAGAGVAMAVGLLVAIGLGGSP